MCDKKCEVCAIDTAGYIPIYLSMPTNKTYAIVYVTDPQYLYFNLHRLNIRRARRMFTNNARGGVCFAFYTSDAFTTQIDVTYRILIAMCGDAIPLPRNVWRATSNMSKKAILASRVIVDPVAQHIVGPDAAVGIVPNTA